VSNDTAGNFDQNNDRCVPEGEQRRVVGTVKAATAEAALRPQIARRRCYNPGRTASRPFGWSYDGRTSRTALDAQTLDEIDDRIAPSVRILLLSSDASACVDAFCCLH